MIKSFYTIKDEIEEKIEVKKSQFIANLFSIESEADYKEKITDIKKKYKDARHYVFAYRLSNGEERYSDDGEPVGTTGMPLLDILRGNDIYNTLIIVTRYFGGILLGTGGLVRAYSDVAKRAINNANIIKKFLATEYEVKISYNDYNTIQHFCSKNGFIIVNSSFSDNIILNILLKEEEEERFNNEIMEILDGKLEYRIIRRNMYV